MSSEFWWYVARSGGILAWVLLSASVLWGLLLSTKILGPKPRANWLLDLHRFLGAMAVIFTGVHVLGLLFDSYIEFGLIDVLVPFTSSYRPGAVAWGVISLYLLLAVEVTSLVRRRLSRRTWRFVHSLSFGLFAFSTIHGLAAGTDAGIGPLFVAMASVSVAVVGLTIASLDQHLRRSNARSSSDETCAGWAVARHTQSQRLARPGAAQIRSRGV